MEILNSNNELIAVVESSELEKTKSQKLLEMFTPYFSCMAEIETKINGLNKTDPQKEDIKISRGIRLALKNNRVASEKVKDDSKAAILIEGRLIDNMNNIIKNTSKGLELQCEQIEKDAEIKEAEAPIKEKLRLAVYTLNLTLPESEISGSIAAKFEGFKTWALQQIETI